MAIIEVALRTGVRPSFPPVKGYIFDLDGTLVDSLPGITHALNTVLASEGMNGHPLHVVRGFIGDGLETTVRRACPECGQNSELLARMVERFRSIYPETWRTGTNVYPGMAGLLAELAAKGMPIGVLTNKFHESAVEMVAEILPEIPFACVLGLQPGIDPKPDPTGALRIASTFGLPVAACRIIGDSTMDIKTAKRAGMKSCAVAWGYHDVPQLLDTQPDHLVNDMHELSKWLLP